MNQSLYLLSAFVIPALAAQQQGSPVTTESLALEIATRAWEVRFKREVIEGYRPYHAFLENGIWHVRSVSTKLKGQRGRGGPQAEISASDGRILKAYIAH